MLIRQLPFGRVFKVLIADGLHMMQSWDLDSIDRFCGMISWIRYWNVRQDHYYLDEYCLREMDEP